MGWKSTLGGAVGAVGGFALGGPGGAMAGYGVGSAIGGGFEDGQKSDQYSKKAMAQAEREYNERAPLRRQGMQALGQIEAPMNLGNLGFNASNPYAAARGPAPSTASYGDWGRMTTSPEHIDAAMSGINPEEAAWAQNALGATYAGKSGGKMRFRGADGKEYTNDDRNHAQQQIKEKYQRGLGYTGQSFDDYVTKLRGVQPIGGAAPPQPAPRMGVQPLGGRR